jgi:predicted TPR repeat methyltransferase
MQASPAPTRIAALLTKPPSVADAAAAQQERAAHLQAAVQLLRHEEIDEADAAFDAFLERYPRDADGVHFQGILRHAQGRSDEALELLRESLALAPENAGHWNNYGNVLLKQGRLEAAAEAYGMSVKLAPSVHDAADSFVNLSTLHRKLEDLRSAEVWARRAVEARPTWGDGWYALAIALVDQDRVPEGLEANSKAITLWPRHLQGRREVVEALLLLDRRDEAAQLYREWLEEEPDNPVIQHQLAACLGDSGTMAAPERASDAYVEQVFDAFASSFDAKLGSLGYRAPQLVADALAARLPAAAARFDVVDLGCGTGLVGPLLRPWARRMAGCDLSVGMLRVARERLVYDVLHKAELVYYLRTQPDAFDVAVSADTLCYFGALEEAMAAAALALRPGGWLAFTVEALADGAGMPHKLQANGRYAHASAYVAEAVTGAGMTLDGIDEVTLRTESGRPVRGWLVVARRPGQGADR